MKLTKTILRELIKEEIQLMEADEMITLPGKTTGGGAMRVDQLQDRIKGKLEDLLSRIERNDWVSIPKEQLLIMAHEWDALRTHLGTPDELDINEAVKQN
jgi:hypothetical protein